MNKFKGNEGGLIDLTLAASWTANYRKTALIDQALPPVKAHFYGRETLQLLLDQENCVGIRIYYALDEAGNKKLVLVGVDADGNDLEEVVVDNGKICPPDCISTGSLQG